MGRKNVQRERREDTDVALYDENRMGEDVNVWDIYMWHEGKL